MIKKKFSLVLHRIVLIAGIMLLSLSFLVPPAAVNAGSPKLQSILDALTSECKEMNRNSGTWKKCEGYQGQLNTYANCTDKMFAEGSNKKWNAKKTGIDDCQTKINNNTEVARRAQAHLDKITVNCNEVKGIEFKICESLQNYLSPLGCSSTMFEEVGGGKWSFKQADVDSCQKTIDSIKTSQPTKSGEGASATANDPSTKEDPCRATGTPLTWIICPMLELGMNMTDFVFKDLVQPLLSDVPVSTNSNDDSYKAWKQFRILGNIILIGTLLAVVYAQARSDQ